MLIKILCLTLIAVVLVQARPSETGLIPSHQLSLEDLQADSPKHISFRSLNEDPPTGVDHSRIRLEQSRSGRQKRLVMALAGVAAKTAYKGTVGVVKALKWAIFR